MYLKRLNMLSTFTPEFQPRAMRLGKKLLRHGQIEIKIYIYVGACIVVW